MNKLRELYRKAAIDHWTELGGEASTGWGQTPEGKYQETRTFEDCAETISRELIETFARHPDDPPTHEVTSVKDEAAP